MVRDARETCQGSALAHKSDGAQRASPPWCHLEQNHRIVFAYEITGTRFGSPSHTRIVPNQSLRKLACPSQTSHTSSDGVRETIPFGDLQHQRPWFQKNAWRRHHTQSVPRSHDLELADGQSSDRTTSVFACKAASKRSVVITPVEGPKCEDVGIKH